jgi:hypothetical protein
MRVIIHGGMPKTGSTSIQDTLGANRSALAERGIVYPELLRARQSQSHWQLCAFDSEEMRERLGLLRVKDLPAGWDRAVIDTLERVLGEAGRLGQTVILSDEGMADPARREGLERLRDLIEGHGGDIAVLVYARPPVELFGSLLQQHLKNLSRARDMGPPDWVSPHPAGLEQFEAVFGAERTHLRLYARGLLAQGDVVADFAAWVGRVAGAELPLPERVAAANPSLSAPACALLVQALDHLPERGDDLVFSRLRSLLIKFDAGMAAPRLTLPPDWRAAILDANREAWNALVDRASHAPQDRDRVRIGPPGPARPAPRTDAAAHLRAGLDMAYVEGFQAYCRAARGMNGALVEPVLARMVAALDRAGAE